MVAVVDSGGATPPKKKTRNVKFRVTEDLAGGVVLIGDRAFREDLAQFLEEAFQRLERRHYVGALAKALRPDPAPPAAGPVE